MKRRYSRDYRIRDQPNNFANRWVIVDDGSTDSTAEIVQGHAKQFRWIELIQRPQRQDRSFAGKASAFNAGFERVRSLQFEVIGNLDADISFERDYFEFLMSKFAELPQIRGRWHRYARSKL